MKKILVIEDDKDVRDAICEMLELNGYCVDQAEDGRQGIQFLECSIPDLVISDIMMPGIDGYQVLNYFQQLPYAMKVPFIFLSAKSDIADLRRGMKSGADDYLTKPFTAKELLESIETQLRKKDRTDSIFQRIYSDISTYVPHELRTPLLPVIGYAELMRISLDELSKEEISEMLSKIQFSGERLLKTINKFIIFSEVQLRLSNKIIYNRMVEENPSSSFSIIGDKCVKAICAAKREDDLLMDLTEANLKISEADLSYITEEIICNAIKFSKTGQQIIVKSKIASNMYVLEITDHGKGMTNEQLININPFVQHERQIFQQQGNGLGLITVKNMLNYYQGSLSISSELDKYTSCLISIPLS